MTQGGCSWLLACSMALAPAWTEPARAAVPGPQGPASEGQARAEGGTLEAAEPLLPLMAGLGLVGAGALALGFGLEGGMPQEGPRFWPLVGLGAGLMASQWGLQALHPQEALGPQWATGLSGLGLALAPPLIELSGLQGPWDRVLVFGLPLAWGASWAWRAQAWSPEAPTQPLQGAPMAWAGGLEAAGLAAGWTWARASVPGSEFGPWLMVASPALAHGLVQGQQGRAGRGLALGAASLGPLALGVALPLLGNAALTGSQTGGRRQLGLEFAILGAFSGWVLGQGLALWAGGWPAPAQLPPAPSTKAKSSPTVRTSIKA